MTRIGAIALAAVLASGAHGQERLADTGLYRPGSTSEIAPGNLPFSPQYPLWSDGAAKRRWLHIPPGKSIDATRVDAWDFPAGTKLWKEFSHDGRRVETRLVERLDDGSWRFAAYVWNEAGTEATLAPENGIAGLEVAGAPRGRYTIPAEADCRACHEGAAVPVLGASAVQLAPELRDMVARGVLRNLPREILEDAPRIRAASPAERAVLGYLHGNCGHCHNDNGAPPPVDLVLAQRAAGGASLARALIGARSRYRAGAATSLITPGRPEESVLVLRMRSRNPQIQMPPLGTQIPDSAALELIERWIRNQPHTTQEP